MNNRINEMFEIYYYYNNKGSDIVEVFSSIEGYEYLIESLKKFIGTLRKDKYSKLSLNYKSDVDGVSTLTFLYKFTGEIDTISVRYNKNIESIEGVSVLATIEGYEYLVECLIELVNMIKLDEDTEIKLDSGIDIDCDSPSLFFFFKE